MPGPSAAGDATPGFVRARVVIVRDDALALIERRRDDSVYYVFPGGGVEPGETAEVAAAREAWEELGLRVVVGACIAEMVARDRCQRFFLATPIGGTLGTGRGAEMAGEYPPARGTYRAVWLPLAALSGVTVYPPVVAEMVAKGGGRGWPATPVLLREPPS